MPHQPNPAGRSDYADTEDQVQTALICHALFVHPAILTIDELMLDVLAGSKDFGEFDTAKNAVRSLVRDGLLHQSGDFLLPVRPVVRFNELRDAGM